jgi:cysteine synthase
MLFHNAQDSIGKTPLVNCGHHKDALLYLKLEGNNPTGSLKDRSARNILIKALATGKLNDKTIFDASSGSFACAIAYFGNLMHKPVTIVVNKKLTSENRRFLTLMGAELIEHGEVTGEGNEYCKQLITQNPEKYFFCDQLNNWDSPRAHYEGTGPEILEDMPDTVAIVASMGSGATLCGIGTYVQNMSSSIQIFASIAAPGASLAGTYKEGIDAYTPFIEKIERDKLVDERFPVTVEQAYANARMLAKKGFFVGPQAGGVYQAAIDAIDKHKIDGRVVIIAGDSGWKNLEKLSAM